MGQTTRIDVTKHRIRRIRLHDWPGDVRVGISQDSHIKVLYEHPAGHLHLRLRGQWQRLWLSDTLHLGHDQAFDDGCTVETEDATANIVGLVSTRMSLSAGLMAGGRWQSSPPALILSIPPRCRVDITGNIGGDLRIWQDYLKVRRSS
jgi:hypothetical protein